MADRDRGFGPGIDRSRKRKKQGCVLVPRKLSVGSFRDHFEQPCSARRSHSVCSPERSQAEASAAPCGRSRLGIQSVCDLCVRPSLCWGRSGRPHAKLTGFAYGREIKEQGRQTAQDQRRPTLENRPFSRHAPPDAPVAESRKAEQAHAVRVCPKYGFGRRSRYPDQPRRTRTYCRTDPREEQLEPACQSTERRRSEDAGSGACPDHPLLRRRNLKTQTP